MRLRSLTKTGREAQNLLVFPRDMDGANMATGSRETRAMMMVVTEVVALEPAYATPMSAACPVIEDAQMRS